MQEISVPYSVPTDCGASEGVDGREECVMSVLSRGYAQNWTLDVIAERVVEALDNLEIEKR
jgi:hypothetical protein